MTVAELAKSAAAASTKSNASRPSRKSRKGSNAQAAQTETAKPTKSADMTATFPADKVTTGNQVRFQASRDGKNAFKGLLYVPADKVPDDAVGVEVSIRYLTK